MYLLNAMYINSFALFTPCYRNRFQNKGFRLIFTWSVCSIYPMLEHCELYNLLYSRCALFSSIDTSVDKHYITFIVSQLSKYGSEYMDTKKIIKEQLIYLQKLQMTKNHKHKQSWEQYIILVRWE